jgi:hypothetical protein
MTRNKTHALLLAAAFALCGVVVASFAPGVSGQNAPAPSPEAQKIIKTHFVVMQMTYQSLQVHGVSDARELHTFTFSPAIRDKMQNILKVGGYQFGDNVVVWYKPGENIAYKIKGKPSKPK